MELFYSKLSGNGRIILAEDESAHCIKVLRHRAGDEISVIDGCGTLYRCRIISDSPKKAEAEIIGTEENWGSHPYRLTLAVAPTKNTDRFEWFAEKACEIGVDAIVPIICSHSERKVFKTERTEKILVSAAKQSLKGAVPNLCKPVTAKEFIDGCAREDGMLKLIAYCFEDGNTKRISIKEALLNYEGDCITVMIGPEGDFSEEEASYAIEQGFIPVHLGASRLRTETAAVTAAEAAYFRYM